MYSLAKMGHGLGCCQRRSFNLGDRNFMNFTWSSIFFELSLELSSSSLTQVLREFQKV